LEFFARTLHTSEFHLARVFRNGTGFSLFGYRRHLRLRVALDLLADPGVELTAVAHTLGFATHSHFTDSFRQTFGVTPSALRRANGSGVLRELRAAVDEPLQMRASSRTELAETR
jgi:AraC-like DNA-binding protein